MKNWFLIILTLASFEAAYSQSTISGTVKNRQHEPVTGASITLLNTYSGATSKQDGSFSFSVSETGQQKIQVTMMGYKDYETEIVIADKTIVLDVILHEMITELQAVTVSAGTFEASDKKRNTILKPIDIVTMAGKQADIIAALSTLPGAQQIGESEGLFIRGGTGQETKVFIDGMMVTNPFFSSVPNIAQRSRFSPLLFKGTNFSSGGYSAQFGQGLSSALTLETHDLPTRTETNIIASSPQLTVTRYQLNKKKTASAGMTVNYNNLKPYFSIVPQTLHYTKAPEIINGELFGRVKTKTGMLKYYGYANYNLVAFDRKSIEGKGLVDLFKLKNKHVFTILTYNAKLKNGWSTQSGIGYSYNKDMIQSTVMTGADTINSFFPDINNQTTQTRSVFTKSLGGLNKLNIGAEYQNVVDKIYAKDSIPAITRTDNYLAVFTESDLYINTKLVTRLGARYERSSLLNDHRISPRVSLAYKIKNGGQFSAAYGMYYQKPEANILFRNPGLQFSKTTHYLVNYQRIANDQTLRVELFHKQYEKLIRFPSENPFNSSNTGGGYARGAELFWRDKKTFKDFSYWVAYSYLDTRRLFLDYPAKVQPSFAANHTVNVVMKQWVQKITSMFSMTYTYASGRPYYNPNLSKKDFMSEKTMDYHNLGFQVNYLTTIKKANAVLILNVNNLLGNKQIYGYRYAANKDDTGHYPGEAIIPTAKRFYFIGIYLSMGVDRRKDVIDN